MAADEFLVMQKQPCVRLYGWEPQCLTLGHHQTSSDLNLNVLKTNGIDITRRPTGGKAVLHWNDLTYSLILPENYFSGTIKQSYEEISLILMDFFISLGLKPEIIQQSVPRNSSPICFEAPGWFEISVQGKKIIGNAQARKNGMLLQQGTIPFELNQQLIKELFQYSNARLSGTCLYDFSKTPESPEEGAKLFHVSLKKFFNLEEKGWEPFELKLIENLVEEKYGADDWVFKK